MKIGEPCTQCGKCCKKEVCDLGIYVYEKATPPCKGLLFHDDKYWCECIEKSRGNVKRHLKFRLGIGIVCDSG